MKNSTHATLRKQLDIWKSCIYDYLQDINDERYPITLKVRQLLIIILAIMGAGIRFAVVMDPLRQLPQHKTNFLSIFLLTIILGFFFILCGILAFGSQRDVSQEDILKIIPFC